MNPSHSNSDGVEELQGEGAAQGTTSMEKGRWLADVFNVLYRGCDKIKPEKQIGTIKVNDDVNDHYLYKVENVDTSKSSLQQIDEPVLNGPGISSISAEDSLRIDVDHFCGTFKDTFYINDCPSDDSIETGSALDDEHDIYEGTLSFESANIKVVMGEKCKIELKVSWKCIWMCREKELPKEQHQ